MSRPVSSFHQRFYFSAGLGADSFGIYAFALAVVMVVGLPAKAGVPQVVMRETVKAQASMLDTYRKALALLSRKEKRRGGLVLGMVIVMAVLETAGVASVDAFILALGAAALGLTLFSAFFRSLVHYAMNRFIEMRRHSVGERLLEIATGQPHGAVPSGSQAASHLGPSARFRLRYLMPGWGSR